MPVFAEIEGEFCKLGRTPKGQRALQGIFRSVRELVSTEGLQETSLDRIADRAGLTQAAVRHYFPTRDELLTSYFVIATRWFQSRMAARLEDDGVAAREKLEACVIWHLEYMEHVDTVFWLEASAYWLRRKPARQVRDEWYAWLMGQYAGLIGRIHPAMNPRERDRRAYAVLTLILGAWITHGRGSAVGGGKALEQRQLLADTAMEIAGA